MNDVFQQARVEALLKAASLAHVVRDGIPYIALEDGNYNEMSGSNVAWWTNGFYAGILWILFRETGNPIYAGFAEAIERKLDRVLDEAVQVDHDAGFLWIPSSVERFRQTGSPDSLQRALRAAKLLKDRFWETTNAIRAWNGEWAKDLAIIDTAMNLSLLYWAGKTTGEPAYAKTAEAVTRTILRHFVRDDGSVRHIVRFDPVSGRAVETLRGQGDTERSSWSRGTSWALYGLAIGFRETRRKEYEEACLRIASFVEDHLDETGVPFADHLEPQSEKRKRDSSAGAIAACGCFLLYEQTKLPWVLKLAHRLLDGLIRHCLADQDKQPLLIHGNVAVHSNLESERDCSLVYGDFFFLQALCMAKGSSSVF